MMFSCGIYQILNTVTGKSYIGSSSEIKKRFMAHTNMLRAGRHDNIHLQRSFDKHGAAAFLFIPFHQCKPDELQETEQFWLDALKITDTGYNICPTSEAGMKGRKHTIESRQKMRDARIGKPATWNMGKKNYPAWNKGLLYGDRIMIRCRECGKWREMFYSGYLSSGSSSKFCSAKCFWASGGRWRLAARS